MKNKIIDNKKIDSKEKNSYLKSIKIGLNELWHRKWKNIFIALYTILAFFIWNICYAIWSLLPLNNLPTLIRDIVRISYLGIIAIVLLLLLSQIIIYIGKLANRKIKNRCKTGFKRCGLKTETGEQPILKDRFPDKETKHGIVYRFDDLQIPISKWQSKTEDIEKILKGKIVRFDIDNEHDMTNVVITPYKYVTPYIVNANDDALSSMENCLIVGQTGSRKKLYSPNYTRKNSYV